MPNFSSIRIAQIVGTLLPRSAIYRYNDCFILLTLWNSLTKLCSRNATSEKRLFSSRVVIQERVAAVAYIVFGRRFRAARVIEKDASIMASYP